jgi:hypothetical protein
MAHRLPLSLKKNHYNQHDNNHDYIYYTNNYCEELGQCVKLRTLVSHWMGDQKFTITSSSVLW